MAKVWENINGKCYCYGHLMSNPGCHGANCRTCCYSLGKTTSTITKIDGIPLFHTWGRALAWGEKFGLNTYHTHTHEGTIGYMAGANHEAALTAVGGMFIPKTKTPPILKIVKPSIPPSVSQDIPQDIPQDTPQAPTSDSSGGGY